MMRFLGVFSLLVLYANSGVAQPAPSPGIPRDGTDLLRGLLAFHGIQPASAESLAQLNPSRLIMISLDSGDTGEGGINLPQLSRRVLRSDGAVLIANNGPLDLGPYFPTATIAQITGETILERRRTLVPVVPGAPGEMDLFLMKNLGVLPDPGWALFAGTTRITVIEPSNILIRKPSPFLRNVYARFSPNATSKSLGTAVPQSRAFAAGATGSGESSYRSLILADSDLLKNRLMVESRSDGEPLTENLAFANRLVVWLKGNGNQAATHCLFVERNQIITNFDTVKFESPLPTIPPINPDQFPSPLNRNFQKKLTETVDSKIQQWQESDGPTRAVFGNLRDDSRFRRVMQALAVALGIVLILATLRKLWKQQHEPSLSLLPKDTGKVAGRAPMGSFQRRCEEMLQIGNHQSIVRDYLRDLFAQAGFPRPSSNEAISREVCQFTGPSAKTLAEPLRILWDTAYGGKSGVVTYSRWKELEPMMESVRAAVAAGTLKMHRVGGTA